MGSKLPHHLPTAKMLSGRLDVGPLWCYLLHPSRRVQARGSEDALTSRRGNSTCYTVLCSRPMLSFRAMRRNNHSRLADRVAQAAQVSLAAQGTWPRSTSSSASD